MSAFILGPGGQMTALQGPRGETPPCPGAKFKRGDVVARRKVWFLEDLPEEFIVAVAIPRDFSPDYAMADMMGKPRPLMAQVGSRSISYLLVREDDPKPYLLKESHLRPTRKPPVEIGTISEQMESRS